MKILADANPLYAGPLTGVGYFTECLLDGLNSTENIEVEGFAFNHLGKKPNSKLLKVNEQKILPGKLLNYPRYAGVELPLECFFNTKGFDVILGTNYLLPPTLHNIPSITTVHDLCFYDHPEWVQSKNAHILKKLLPNTIKRSAGIITISEFSLSRIREIYDYTGPALVVDIPPKDSLAEATKPQALQVKIHKYFLYIGTIEPRKNLTTALDAYENLPTSVQENYPFILAGKPGWDPDVLSRIRSSKNTHIQYLDYVTESERTWLYKNASVTIIPSHYEGFGMMTLESLALNTPTITSDIPPQREILGESGEYFTIDNAQELTQTMLKFTDESYRAQVLNNQRKVLEKYSWDEVVRKTIRFIEGVLRK